jgi:hypothetical protein
MSQQTKNLTTISRYPVLQNPKQNKQDILQKKLGLISSELSIIDPESLLLVSDPSVKEATEIIEQIQTYYSLIQNEINAIVNNI